MLKLRKGLVTGLLILLVFTLALPSAGALTVNTRFDAGKQITWPLEYKDDFFVRSGKTYHQDTALLSLGLALSAFRAKEQDLSHKASNVIQYLTDMGFSDISLTQFDIEPTVKTIATAIARKTITSPNGDFQVIAVAVSGGGYQDEWKSNFSVGNGLHHEGFDQAARQVVDRILAYIKAHSVKDARVWMSGYSRAAATANRAAALLLERRVVKSDNLFAYTFATPNNTKQQNAADFPSIFNVVGSFDPVPMVPFADWGFTRYGQTFFLPAAEINSDYNRRAEPVRLVYSGMTGTEYWSNSSSNAVLQKVLGAMSESIPDTKTYQSNLQGYMLNLWTNRKNPLQALVTTAQEIVKAPDFRTTMKDLGDKMLTIFSSVTQEKIMQESGMLKDEWRNDGGVTDNLVHEHMPTVYLSWMSAYQTGEGLFTPAAAYREVRVKNPGRIQVIDKNGSLAANYDGHYRTAQNKSRLPMAMSGDELVITVPSDAWYQVVIQRGEGMATGFRIREGVAGRTRMQSFQAKEGILQSAQTFSLELPTQETWQQSSYLLKWEGGQAVLQQVPTESSLSQMEMDSGARDFLSQNIRTAILVLVAVVIQIVFYLFVLFRAGRSAGHNRKLRRTGEYQVFREHRLVRNPGKKPVTRLKILSLLLCLVALAAIAGFVLLFLVWRSEFAALERTMIFWYGTLYLLPFSLVMLFSGLPSLFTGLYGIFWRGGTYRLKSVRIYAIPALLFAALQLFLNLTDINNPPNILVVALSVAQILLLLAVLLTYRACMKQEVGQGKAKVAEPSLPEPEADAAN